MKISFRKSIALILCISFIVTFCFNSVTASDNNIQVVANEANKVKIIKNDADSCTVMTEYLGDDPAYIGTILYATIDKKTNEITMQTVEKAKKKAFGLLTSGKDKVKKYKVKIENAVDEKFSSTLTDMETKKEYKIGHSDDKVKAQIPFLAWGLSATAVALIQALLVTTATIVILGVTYVAATQIADTLRREMKFNYYMACIPSGKNDVYIGNPYPNDSAAFSAVRSGANCFAITYWKAEEAARKGGSGIPYHHNAHGSGDGYWNHWHPRTITGGVGKQHCWY